MIDRFDEIKAKSGPGLPKSDHRDATLDEVHWLIGEIERLRRIEDKALLWSVSPGARAVPDFPDKELSRVLRENQRPKPAQ